MVSDKYRLWHYSQMLAELCTSFIATCFFGRNVFLIWWLFLLFSFAAAACVICGSYWLLCTSQCESPGGGPRAYQGILTTTFEPYREVWQSPCSPGWGFLTKWIKYIERYRDFLTVHPLDIQGILTTKIFNVRNPLVCPRSPPWGYTLTGA